jgi:hypothetical protein
MSSWRDFALRDEFSRETPMEQVAPNEFAGPMRGFA